jgi:hypothetical protein
MRGGTGTRHGYVSVVLLVLLVVAGCARERVPEAFGPTDGYIAYTASLVRMDLDETELGAAWIEAGEAALNAPEPVSISYEDSGFVDPEQPGARGISFALERRGGVQIRAELQGAPETRAFLDAFRVSDDGPIPVASAPPERLELRFFARRPGVYVVRFQPELLRGGEYTLMVRRIDRRELTFQDEPEN